MGTMIPIDPEGNLQEPIEKAAETLLSGGLVAFPTETFYGLGADINLENAVEKLFRAKGRPATRPILILLPDRESVRRYVSQVPPLAERLMPGPDPVPDKESTERYVSRMTPLAERLINTFWPDHPGFSCRTRCLSLLTAGTGKIGIRLSSHPIATALARAIGSPITGTSANLSGTPPCRTAEEVHRSLGDKVDLVLDGGKTPGEKASTILDVTREPPRILREGLISREQLEPFF